MSVDSIWAAANGVCGSLSGLAEFGEMDLQAPWFCFRTSLFLCTRLRPASRLPKLSELMGPKRGASGFKQWRPRHLSEARTALIDTRIAQEIADVARPFQDETRYVQQARLGLG